VTVWLAGGIVLSAVFWIAFDRLRRRFDASRAQAWAAAVQVGPAGLLSVASWRSVLDPNYIGYGLGLLHFSGRSAASLRHWSWYLCSRPRGSSFASVAGLRLRRARGSYQ
jgi:hypothetical protein